MPKASIRGNTPHIVSNIRGSPPSLHKQIFIQQSHIKMLTTSPPQTSIRTDVPHALLHPRHFSLPLLDLPPRLDCHSLRPVRDTLRQPNVQTNIHLPLRLPLLASERRIQNPNLPPQRRFLGPDLLGYLEGEMECSIECAECVVELAKSTGRAE